MPSPYVRFVLFKGGRFYALGANAGSVTYWEHDREAEATASGEAWIAGEAAPMHRWFTLFGQMQDGHLVRLAGEDT